VNVSSGAPDCAAEHVLARVQERLRRRQCERPWVMGLTSLALAQALDVPEPDLVRTLAGFVASGRLAYRSGYYATTDFSPRLTGEQQEFFDNAFPSQSGAAPVPLPLAELRARVKTSPVPDLRYALETLIASGTLAKVGDFVYLGSHVAAIRAQLEAALRAHGSVTVAEFRTLAGTSRKYAVPLLEYFDATGVTQRAGDLRLLRANPPPEL
jgi:selenocysteine-specific elongation factor